jgi:hypothetical protein
MIAASVQTNENIVIASWALKFTHVRIQKEMEK